jgi:hypothetical protein
MGKPASKSAGPCDFGRQAPDCWKPLSISAFTRRTMWTALRVYARKRIAVMPELHILKLLIQSALTLVNRIKGSVYRQHPIWG